MKNSLPKVSVVCAWYNRAEYIADSVESLVNQEYNNIEIVIINDGSTDKDVVPILERYSSNKVKVIHQENQGFTQTIRNAIAYTSGEFIAIHGAGDISNPQRVTKLVEAFIADESAVAVGSGTIQYPAAYPFRKRYFKPKQNSSNVQLQKNMPFVHGTVMYKRTAYEEVGGYDARFKYCADWDLFFRLSELGEIISVSDFLYEQRIFSDGFSFSPDHKFKQVWFKERAVNRSVGSRNLLNEAEKHLLNIRPEKSSNMRYSFKFLLKSIYKFDFVNSFEWGKLMFLQMKNIIRKK
ncbi:glycosyltransferase [Pseudoalteromonas sp. SR43-7]|uniref:glycosyltransferase family 2 protein n=1 Tax=Pseudoalteromonas sp. SR43-7 TaxID=2760939 RepID=UPI0015FDC57F|nr:glycosyltransferase [Pseudoalteromonas sp. SR43-7]MBB1328172.1 glycosyltransferase [Pseudoalteromonas sp. SR43-7]